MKLKFKRLSIHHQAWLFGSFFCITLLILVASIVASSSMSRSSNQEFMLNILFDAYHDAYLLSGGKKVENSVTEEFYNTYFIILDDKGNKLYGNAENWLHSEPAKPGLNYQKIKKHPEDINTISLRYISKELPDGNQLVVGQNITALDVDHPTGYWVVFLILGAMATAGVASILLGFFIIRRLDNINNTSKLIIETGDLSKRIPCDGSGKDFDALAENLNIMLEKIQQLMADVRQVSDNIAHDLRTPLTRLRHKLDFIEQEDISAKERLDAVSSLKNEADNLLNVFSALLRITNIESGRRHNQFSTIKLDSLLADIFELYEPLAAEKNQQLLLTTAPCCLIADGDLLFQTLANIVDNAVKYTPQGGEISLRLASSGDHINIEISDNGIGVEEKEIPKLFRRFYRVEQSRNQTGNGLGLSLVSAVIALHKGDIQLMQNKPGLKVVISLPKNNR